MYELHRVQELRQPFERVVLALNRDDETVGGGQHVQRDEPERRRAVDDDVAVVIPQIAERLAHARLASVLIDELDFGAHQILGCGNHIEVREMHVREPRLDERRAVDERLVERMANAIALDAHAARRIALRIRVDEERLSLGRRERRREIDGGRRFTHATFLVRDRDYS